MLIGLSQIALREELVQSPDALNLFLPPLPHRTSFFTLLMPAILSTWVFMAILALHILLESAFVSTLSSLLYLNITFSLWSILSPSLKLQCIHIPSPTMHLLNT